MQRALGGVRVAMRPLDGRTRIADLSQVGCLKVRFPHSADGLECVLLNNAGGVAGGDRLITRLRVAEGAQATVTTAAAERLYRARADDVPAILRTSIGLGEAATLEFLPQETILFDGCLASRTLSVHMAASARFVGIDSLILGRTASGEHLTRVMLRDLIRVVRDGRLLLHDATRLVDTPPRLAGAATFRGMLAAATLFLVAPGAEASLDPLRAAFAGLDAEAGASAWDGMLIARVVARDGACLRRAIVAGLTVLRGGRPPPRVWQC